MPAAKAARSAANSRTATGRGTKGLVLAGVGLPVERSDVGVRPEVVARQEPPTTASLPAEVGGGLGLGPKGDGEYEDPRGRTEGPCPVRRRRWRHPRRRGRRPLHRLENPA